MQSTYENNKKNKKNVNEIVNEILDCDYVEVRKKPKKSGDYLPSVNILTGKRVYEYPIKKNKK
ncbi:hypothetical protein ACNF42_05820 [Cuniculiplasma sp. SKW3]|uniref:hypothetical protein n=1 Tax=unclassified Cuniculiplasma TaxID=2619706 RepID=UPI003FD1463A